MKRHCAYPPGDAVELSIGRPIRLELRVNERALINAGFAYLCFVGCRRIFEIRKLSITQDTDGRHKDSIKKSEIPYALKHRIFNSLQFNRFTCPADKF
jgi:hypothetical protein